MPPLLPETHLCLSSVEPSSSKDHFPLFFSAGEESLPPAHPATGLGWAGPTLKLVSPPPRAQFTVFLCGSSQPVLDDAS